MISLDDIVHFALTDRRVMDAIGAALRSDLVNPRPLLRQVVEFADDFVAKRGELPGPGDYHLWVMSFPEEQQRAIRETVGKATKPRDLSGYTPEYFGQRVAEDLKEAAARTALARLNSLAEPSAEAFARVNEQIARIQVGGDRAVREAFPTLQDLMEQLDQRIEPSEVIPRLAWRGRHSLLAGLAKLGKSTLMSEGAAAVTRAAPFLDGVAAEGLVVWIGIDEHVEDTVRRLQGLGARPNRLRIFGGSRDLERLLPEIVRVEAPDLLVLDSLIEYARRVHKDVPGDGDSAGWASVIRPLTALAHDHDIALVTLHHGRRSDGRVRSSGEIEAAVDHLVEMLGPRSGEPPTRRRFDGRGRWRRDFWSTELVDGRYVIHRKGEPQRTSGNDRDQEIVAEVERFLRSSPGASQAEIVREVQGRTSAIEGVLRAMEDDGRVQVDREGPGLPSRHFLPESSEEKLAGGHG